jgi:hypothetical protein
MDGHQMFSYLMENHHSGEVEVPSVEHLLRKRPFNISSCDAQLNKACGGGNFDFLINTKTQT